VKENVTPETLAGVFVVDKPAGWTSHDVVNKFRRIAQTKKVGHLGTLDPIATGVLPLLVGKATRLAQFFQRNDKVYEATIRLGFSTDTYDSEGSPTSAEAQVDVELETVKQEVRSFEGRHPQTPPPISAKKIAGTPAYKLARRNVPVVLQPIEVEVFSIELLRHEGFEVDVRVHCGSGTYVRSIAHELGQRLGCGAHLSHLRRTAAGPFSLQTARMLDELKDLADEGHLREALIPAAQLLPEFPAQLVDAPTAGFIRQGRDFRTSPFRPGAGSRFVKAVTMEGDLVAIGEARLPHLYHPILVL
jgi:tRNA pseudouridine55 synthase